MSEKLSIKCPSCGASLDYNEKKESGVCPYCGTQVVFKKSEKERASLRPAPSRVSSEVQPKKPFYWRTVFYIWLASLAFLAILMVLFPVEAPGSPNSIRAARVDSFLYFDLFAGIAVLLGYGLWKLIRFLYDRIHDLIAYRIPEMKRRRLYRRNHHPS